MTSFEPLGAEHADALIDLWNRAFGPDFPMDRRLFDQNVLGHRAYEAGDGRVAFHRGRPVGFVVTRGARPSTGTGWLVALAVDPQDQGLGIGSGLLAEAETRLSRTGAAQVEAGGSPGHFFPGAPTPASRDFLVRRGYRELGEVVDLVQDLDDVEVPAELARVLEAAHARVFGCPPGREDELMAFLAREFPGRWEEETRHRLSVEGGADVLVLDVDGRIAGFCHTFHPGSKVLGPSIYWRGALGPAYGGLGPIGVDASVRGKRLGWALTWGAIAHVRAHGTRRMAVDWTDLVDFYGKAGFAPWRRYTRMSKTLA